MRSIFIGNVDLLTKIEEDALKKYLAEQDIAFKEMDTSKPEKFDFDGAIDALVVEAKRELLEKLRVRFHNASHFDAKAFKQALYVEDLKKVLDKTMMELMTYEKKSSVEKKDSPQD